MLRIKLNDNAADNAAFEEDARAEVCRILRHVTDRIERGDEEGQCRDINGNTVGEWWCDIPEPEEEEAADE